MSAAGPASGTDELTIFQMASNGIGACVGPITGVGPPGRTVSNADVSSISGFQFKDVVLTDAGEVIEVRNEPSKRRRGRR